MISGEAARLRRAFDSSFSQAPCERLASCDFLVIRLGEVRLAIRLAAIAGLHLDRPIVPVPTRVPWFLGITGLRGSIVAVYDLARLLGHVRHATPRWLALVRAPAPAALAFDGIEAHLRAFDANLPAASPEPSNQRHLQGTIRIEGANCPIIDVASVIKAISQATGGPTSEQ